MVTSHAKKWTCAIPLSAIAGALAWLIWGLVSYRLLYQPVWLYDGLKRMAVFGAAYGIAALAAYLVCRRALLPLLLLFSLLAAVTSVGPGPIVAVLFIAASALALGDMLRIACGLPREPALAFLVFLLGICPMVLAVSFLVHFSVNYRSLYWVGLSVPLFLNRGALKHYARELASWPRSRMVESTAGFGAIALTGAVLLTHLLVVLKPEISHDGMAIHLAVPAYVADFGYWHFDATRLIWALTPMGADWVYTTAYLLGGEPATRLINFLFLLVILSMLYRLARRWLRPAQALLPVCLFASTPLVQLVTGSLFVENMQAALILCALVSIESLVRGRQVGWMVPAAAFLGTALSIKFGSVAFVAPLAALGGIRWLASPPGRRVLRLDVAAAAAAIFFMTALPPYLYAWHRSGNPFYPFLEERFPSPVLPQVGFANPFKPEFNALNALDRLTFSSHQFMESQDGALGFHYLVFLPASLLLIGRAGFRRVGLAALVALVASASTLWLQPNLRYLYSAAALASVLIAYLMAWLFRRGTAISRGTVILVLGLVALNTYFMPASGWYHRAFHVWRLGSDADRREYVDGHTPVRKLVEYLNLRHPGAPAWFLGTSQIAMFRGRVYLYNWYQHNFVMQVRACRNATDVRNLVRREQLAHFIVPKDTDDPRIVPPPVRDFFRTATEQEWEYGSFVLLRLKPDPI